MMQECTTTSLKVCLKGFTGTETPPPKRPDSVQAEIKQKTNQLYKTNHLIEEHVNNGHVKRS